MAASIRITVSGEIPEGLTTGSVTYFVLDLTKKSVVGSLVLPNAGQQIRRFRIAVDVPSSSNNFDVGLFDKDGRFVSANFAIEVPVAPKGAVGHT